MIEKQLLPQLQKITQYMGHAVEHDNSEAAHNQADALIMSVVRLLADGRSAAVRAELDELVGNYYKMIRWGE